MATYLKYIIGETLIEYVGTMTIDADTEVSNYLTAEVYGRFRKLMIVHEDADLVGGVTLYAIDNVGSDLDTAGNWKQVEQPSATALAFAATKATVIDTPAALAIRLQSDGNETGDEAFAVYGIK